MDPFRFQFAPPDSSVRNSRANGTTISRMRLVIPYWIPCSSASYHQRPSCKSTFQIHHLCCQRLQISGTSNIICVTAVHPLFLKAKSEASKADNPKIHHAMIVPFADEYWNAAEKENNSWASGMLFSMKMTWILLMELVLSKCKQFPNSTVQKPNTHFCAHGDQQVEGIDFFETYSPLVHLPDADS